MCCDLPLEFICKQHWSRLLSGCPSHHALKFLGVLSAQNQWPAWKTENSIRTMNSNKNYCNSISTIKTSFSEILPLGKQSLQSKILAMRQMSGPEWTDAPRRCVLMQGLHGVTDSCSAVEINVQSYQLAVNQACNSILLQQFKSNLNPYDYLSVRPSHL